MAMAEAAAAAMNGKIVRIVQSTEGGIDPGHVAASYNDYAMSVANATGISMERKPMTPVRAGEQNVRSQVVLVVDIRAE